MHPQDPDGLLTPEDKENIRKVQEQILQDRENKTNKVSENVASDCEQLHNKLKEKRDRLEQ